MHRRQGQARFGDNHIIESVEIANGSHSFGGEQDLPLRNLATNQASIAALRGDGDPGLPANPHHRRHLSCCLGQD